MLSQNDWERLETRYKIAIILKGAGWTQKNDIQIEETHVILVIVTIITSIVVVILAYWLIRPT